jgi:GNAT superfamily N-acetyltransferase
VIAGIRSTGLGRRISGFSGFCDFRPETRPKSAIAAERIISACRREPRVNITYALEPDLAADEFIDLLVRSTLSERRPIADRARIDVMLRRADVIVAARVAGRLVGVSRAISDFSYATYLSDLAVDEQFQRQGIGRELIHRTHAAAGKQTMLILLAAPKARSYYPHIGMQPHDSCWFVPREESCGKRIGNSE